MRSLFSFFLDAKRNKTCLPAGRNQDLDFQRSITFLMPKRKELAKTQTAFLFTASSNY